MAPAPPEAGRHRPGAHLEQPSSPHRLIHTDTTIHLTCIPGLLTGTQRQNLYNTGHTAASLAPGEAAALTRLLHRTARGLTPDLPADQIPRLANRRLLAPAGNQPAAHPDVLFALGLAAHPLLDAAGPQVLDHRPAAADPGPHRRVHHADAAHAEFTDSLLPVPAAAPPQPPRPR
ncbi:hypothetical protein [Streptomyces sp. JJ66]|uniref:hypothetical protein n=1 Tax=Streptomyces sp. JJ66 TaxID=2803843 RepID=UPI00214B82D4|nr:hypothetical protein [Streptomyces sp. JJ66]